MRERRGPSLSRSGPIQSQRTKLLATTARKGFTRIEAHNLSRRLASPRPHPIPRNTRSHTLEETPYLSLPEVASVSSGERSMLLRRRGAPPEDPLEVDTPVAACWGAITWAVAPGSTIPLTGVKFPKGDPNMPMGRQPAP